VPTPANAVYQFGQFEVNAASGELFKNGRRVKLQEQPFRLLVVLLEKAGDIVTREELRSRIWPEDTFVDFEGSLRVAVRKLRDALDDDPESPRYVETIPKRGYRFLGPATRPGELRSGFHSLAVLPFTNGTGPPEAEYLSEGISESIINLLSQFPDLRVVPRTSAFRYKGLETELKKVGRDLNVDVVLTGTVTQRGDRLIVQTELVDVANDTQLWGGQFNRTLEDIFELQEELARRISESLRPRLSPDEDKFLNKRPTENREAYHLYLKAMYYANKWSPEGIQKGIAYSKQAIEIDPLFARAYAGLAYIYILLGIFGGLPPSQAFPMAKAAALKALEIDDSMATAHACLAYLLLAYDWDWAGAEKESRRAIELAPNIPGGHYTRSQWCLVNRRPEEAIAEARITLELDPLSLPNHQLLAGTYHMLGEYDAAIEQAHKALELDSSFTPAQLLLALSYAYSGRSEEAFAQAERAGAFSEGNAQTNILPMGIGGIIYALAGKHAEARAVVARLSQSQPPYQYISAHGCAAIHALLGEKDQAFQWIERALPGRGLFQLNIRPEFKNLHTDPRFSDLLRRMGLPE